MLSGEVVPLLALVATQRERAAECAGVADSRSVGCGCASVSVRVSGEGGDAFAQGGMGSEDAVVAVAMDARRRDQAGDSGEEVER